MIDHTSPTFDDVVFNGNVVKASKISLDELTWSVMWDIDVPFSLNIRSGGDVRAAYFDKANGTSMSVRGGCHRVVVLVTDAVRRDVDVTDERPLNPTLRELRTLVDNLVADYLGI